MPQTRLEMSGDLVKINWFCWRTHGRICLEVSFKNTGSSCHKHTRRCPEVSSKTPGTVFLNMARVRSRNHKNSRMCPEVSLGRVALSSQTWLETFFHDFLPKYCFVVQTWYHTYKCLTAVLLWLATLVTCKHPPPPADMKMLGHKHVTWTWCDTFCWTVKCFVQQIVSWWLRQTLPDFSSDQLTHEARHA